MRVTILILCPTVGGSEKRYARLYRHLRQRGRHSYRLMLPDGLFRALRDQGILPERDPAVIPLFRRFPASLYSRYPLTWRGRRVKGINHLIYTAAAREMHTPRMRRLLGETDLIHNVSPVDFLKDLLPGPRPMVQEAMDYTRVELTFPAVRQWLANPRVHFNCLSGNIHRAYREALGEGARRRAHLGPGSVVDGDVFRPGEKEPLVLFVGRMSPLKNPLLFVEAMAELAKRRRDVRAVMLGTGELNHEVEASIRRHGLRDRVRRRFHAAPQEWMARALIYVSLQTGENYPSQALLEAMASGCAVVATDVGETWRLVTEATGYRIPPDPVACADRLDRLLADPEHTRGLGAAARRLVLKAHTLEAYAEHLESLYDSLAST